MKIYRNCKGFHSGIHTVCVLCAYLGIAGGMQNLSLHQPSAATARSLGTGNSQVIIIVLCACVFMSVCVYVCVSVSSV